MFGGGLIHPMTLGMRVESQASFLSINSSTPRVSQPFSSSEFSLRGEVHAGMEMGLWDSRRWMERGPKSLSLLFILFVCRSPLSALSS